MVSLRREGAHLQDRADAGQHRLPLYVQLLHRLRGGLPSPSVRADAQRSALPARQDAQATRRLADPNLGVRFDDYMGAIEEAVRPGRLDFTAESSLSLRRAGFPIIRDARQAGHGSAGPGVLRRENPGSSQSSSRSTFAGATPALGKRCPPVRSSMSRTPGCRASAAPSGWNPTRRRCFEPIPRTAARCFSADHRFSSPDGCRLTVCNKARSAIRITGGDRSSRTNAWLRRARCQAPDRPSG